MQTQRVAVRAMVERVMNSGDIDSRYVDSSTMHAGAKMHRRLQKQMGEHYQKEVPLQLLCTIRDMPVLLHGRADGIMKAADGSYILDEIKTTISPLDHLFLQHTTHMAQATCYAHMFLQTQEKSLQQMTIQLTYCHLETGETKRHAWTFTREQIAASFEGLLERYAVWLQLSYDVRQRRDQSIQTLAFPFDSYRKGQRELAVSVYSAIEKNKKLYVQAPTGIGKTLSTVFPAIKAMGAGKMDKLFYLTAKTVTRAAANDAIRLMQEKGLQIKAVTLRAKDKICFCQERICTPAHCSYASGHFDRLNDALLDLIGRESLITPEVTCAYAKKHCVCPYEFSLDASEWADIVICDYNHVFDPVVYLRRFFGSPSGRYVFLVDEAHNLYERVRDMYSVQIHKSAFLQIKRQLQGKAGVVKALRAALSGVNAHLLAVRKSPATQEVNMELDRELCALLRQFADAAGAFVALEANRAHPLHQEVLTLFFEVSRFLGIAEGFGAHYAALTSIHGSEVGYTLFCLDPSLIIKERLTLAAASILFSATLNPILYYRDILGGGVEDGTLTIASPFDSEKLLLLAHYGISTKYAHREASILPIVEVIGRTVEKKRGNYIVYFPSYEYMHHVVTQFSCRYPLIDTLVQERQMEEADREAFLLRFDAGNPNTLVGFCVLGGIFSEGIDLSGDRLVGSIIVGVGLPKLSFRQNLIRDYFQNKNGDGYAYAYVYPGMNKVLQAAGRVIRSETDSGLVLLIDSRFHTEQYHMLYPDHWQGIEFINTTAQLERALALFYNNP